MPKQAKHFPGVTSLTGEWLAERFGVPLCPRSCWIGALERHRIGWVDIHGTIHWKPRTMTVAGLRIFLKLVARSQLGTLGAPSGWAIWVEATEAYQMALDLGFRIPRELSANDRAQVRAWLATGPNLDDETQERIVRWAREDA